jgi:hypothetical protein
VNWPAPIKTGVLSRTARSRFVSLGGDRKGQIGPNKRFSAPHIFEALSA